MDFAGWVLVDDPPRKKQMAEIYQRGLAEHRGVLRRVALDRAVRALVRHNGPSCPIWSTPRGTRIRSPAAAESHFRTGTTGDAVDPDGPLATLRHAR